MTEKEASPITFKEHLDRVLYSRHQYALWNIRAAIEEIAAKIDEQDARIDKLGLDPKLKIGIEKPLKVAFVNSEGEEVGFEEYYPQTICCHVTQEGKDKCPKCWSQNRFLM
jgi:hypothetical protein